ncbi:5-methylthioadenosine/S-adenosylhomocysteine deaminase [Tolypocladium ophioglossoides CBS 100239]|uniref:5-methylthioadenosine/S-adenosylhomocysteine deaminase n=1 Tax=Tolypocladium ophioglossoides (strain CBS 100239) TaxID=1163406 RepID=A0A0L0NFI0_TOLOC|nr:5-methylthioadenosine/S-adenosylhomocysteine deaminase [Tolypocladium ophioglossoides CBS 100239]
MPSILYLLTVLGLSNRLVNASSTLFWGGTVVAFDEDSKSLSVIRNGSVLVTNDRIAAGEFAAASSFRPEDVYLGQLVGLYEALNGGVTTTLDHAHHTWSNATAYAGLNASIESGARVIWSYAFHNISSLNYTISDQIPNFREIAASNVLDGTATELGIAFDAWGPNPNIPETEEIVHLAREYNVSVITTHCLAGPWGVNNLPEDVHAFGILNDSIPVVFSHGSFITAWGAQLLRSTNQYLSITPESEMHYGHTHPHSYVTQDQTALGVDTHFTFSSDILTQARLWLQAARYHFFSAVLDQWRVPSRNPMSVVQAFQLATRAGGLALRRPDLGVIRVGAKADVVVWNARESPSMLGWVDPVAAVMLHASVGDVLHVMVDGKFVKRDGKILASDYQAVRDRFLASARRIQSIWRDKPYPVVSGQSSSGYEYEEPLEVGTMRGQGTGYGELFV